LVLGRGNLGTCVIMLHVCTWTRYGAVRSVSIFMSWAWKESGYGAIGFGVLEDKNGELDLR